MMVSKRHRFIFVHIYKTGGTSLTRALAPLVEPEYREAETRESGLGWQGTWHFNGNQHARLAQLLPQMRAAGVKPLTRYRLVGFVRNPYTWIESVWRNFYAKPRAGASRWFGTLYPDRSFPSFCQFIDACADGLNPNVWGAATQVSFFRNPVKPPDFIGRFEDYDAEANRLMRFLGLPELDRIPHELKKGRASRAPDFDPASLAIINRLFAEDFEAYGYEMQAVPGRI